MSKTLPITKGEIISLLKDCRQHSGDDWGCLTIGINDDATAWGYQTGDNSFIGGAYGFPNWGVVDVDAETDLSDAADDMIAQLEECLE